MPTIIFSDQMNQPYGEWITECLQALSEKKVTSVGIVGICEDGDTVTGYWNTDCVGKSEMSQHIQADYIDQLVSANFSKYLAAHGIITDESEEPNL